MIKKNYQPKPDFIERIKTLLEDNRDVEKFFEIAKTQPKKSVRVNILKISPEQLIKKLKQKNWKIYQPFSEYPEIIIIESDLEPGEIGKTREHLLGYYYVQEITSMMPIIALQPKSSENFLDLCASPGSKTTQAAAFMNNRGSIIANDLSIKRIRILSANLERFGVTNTITTRHEGLELCNKLKKLKFQFDKILVDAPCSGEGNIRTSPRTFLEWSEPLLLSLSKKQKKLASAVLEILRPGGEMIYSTCTYSPEENELVIQHLLENNNIEILPVKLPIKTRPGITKWKNNNLDKKLKNCIR
ncbi:NOL1/NOP2/sun family putative RNA methylase, partial [Candidatus Pacearchaeota archaeon]|nr:NOL1/NOP2/sun family putative RNA methylase [Candidatus Pacearchaeota archaeon]